MHGTRYEIHSPAAYMITVQWSKRSHYYRTQVSVFIAHLCVPKGSSLAILPGCSTQRGLSLDLRLSRHRAAKFRKWVSARHQHAAAAY